MVLKYPRTIGFEFEPKQYLVTVFIQAHSILVTPALYFPSSGLEVFCFWLDGSQSRTCMTTCPPTDSGFPLGFALKPKKGCGTLKQRIAKEHNLGSVQSPASGVSRLLGRPKWVEPFCLDAPFWVSLVFFGKKLQRPTSLQLVSWIGGG